LALHAERDAVFDDVERLERHRRHALGPVDAEATVAEVVAKLEGGDDVGVAQQRASRAGRRDVLGAGEVRERAAPVASPPGTLRIAADAAVVVTAALQVDCGSDPKRFPFPGESRWKSRAAT
jgi:hypothetical protein